MSDTPRTDALSRHTPYDEIARTLERELSAVTRERDDAYANVEDADRELKALRSEVEKLREQLRDSRKAHDDLIRRIQMDTGL